MENLMIFQNIIDSWNEDEIVYYFIYSQAVCIFSFYISYCLPTINLLKFSFIHFHMSSLKTLKTYNIWDSARSYGGRQRLLRNINSCSLLLKSIHPWKENYNPKGAWNLKLMVSNKIPNSIINFQLVIILYIHISIFLCSLPHAKKWMT